MLEELHVAGLGVIEDLTISFQSGMTAITGETGAGKTLVIEAVDLLTGGRANASMVRQDERAARLEARFALGKREAGALAELGIHASEELVLAREVLSQGRSRAWANGSMVSSAQLGSIGAVLVDLHGQHAQQSLLSVEARRAALDAFAGYDPVVLRRAREHLRRLEKELSMLGADEGALAREKDMLAFQIAEIEGAAIKGEDEDEQLQEQEEMLASAESRREALLAALELLEAEDSWAGRNPSSAADQLAKASGLLAAYGNLKDLSSRLASLSEEARELARELRGLSEQVTSDPQRLSEIQARRAQLSNLKRKYGANLAEVVDFLGKAHKRLEEIEGSSKRREEISKELGDAMVELRQVEREAVAIRKRAAPQLAKRATEHLRQLAMPAAELRVEVGEANGGDEVEFLLSANPGERPLPLGKVASGGELARAMLALDLVVGVDRPVVIFDEVDSGVGGAAGSSIGDALACLANKGVQVLVVTHLAQVACMADHQIVLEKDARMRGEGLRSVTSARVLEGEERIKELARMLSGDPESASAKAHARELLARSARGS